MARFLLDAFDDAFQREIRQARNYPDAYEKASEQWERSHGFTAFKDYDSFRKKKENKRRSRSK